MRTDLVRVIWNDAHAVTDAWTPVADLDSDPCVVHSVGHLLPEVKRGHLVLAQSMIDERAEVDAVLAIPTAMIVRVEVLTATPLLPVEPLDV